MLLRDQRNQEHPRATGRWLTGAGPEMWYPGHTVERARVRQFQTHLSREGKNEVKDWGWGYGSVGEMFPV